MPSPRVAVAASGGCDSTALLHCTVRQARALGIHVVALHVHHGLSPQADDWLTRVRAQSRRWGVEFHASRLAGAPAPGQSVEAWARRERYLALAEMATAAGCTLVLLAQHQRDQAETWLLQALRGAGAAGLSAMPHSATKHGVGFARPWLGCSRHAVEAYVRRHRLSWVDDASNVDARFARSRLRTAVWPALLTAFPDAELSISRAAQHAQEAAAVLAEVVAQEMPALQRNGALVVAAWRELSPHRRRLCLRAWLACELDAPVPETLVRRLTLELPAAHASRWPVRTHELRLYRGLLRVLPTPGAANANPKDSIALDLSQSGCHQLPEWGGHFLVQAARQDGVPAAILRELHARPRSGGEQFQRVCRGAVRSLKKQFQALAVPQLQRGGPLLYGCGGQLVFVPGLGADARFHAAPGEPQVQLSWVPDAPDLPPVAD